MEEIHTRARTIPRPLNEVTKPIALSKFRKQEIIVISSDEEDIKATVSPEPCQDAVPAQEGRDSVPVQSDEGTSSAQSDLEYIIAQTYRDTISGQSDQDFTTELSNQDTIPAQSDQGSASTQSNQEVVSGQIAYKQSDKLQLMNMEQSQRADIHTLRTVAAGAVPPSLPPSVEEAYRKKCIELKRRMTEVEESNDSYRLRKARLQRGIRKMRLERAYLLEILGKRMKKNGGSVDGFQGIYDEDSEGSSEAPPTVRPFPRFLTTLYAAI